VIRNIPDIQAQVLTTGTKYKPCYKGITYIILQILNIDQLYHSILVKPSTEVLVKTSTQNTYTVYEDRGLRGTI
jgi:hypothetical protein